MFRLTLLILLAAAPLLAQTPTAPKHSKTPADSIDDKWLAQVSPLENRARQILKVELSRKPGPACDDAKYLVKFSNAEYTRCHEADEAITQHNYEAFVDALSASLSILPSDEDPSVYPLPSRNFTTAEAAWRTYLDKTCLALGDTFGGGTGAGAAIARCQQSLTREHMKDLNEIFLERKFS
ncbi:MAG TPA: lysozyme inhibitor LprI family protein [Bryocella sp.]|nr:lysozyme inhibitor LprI family protein [Bryocella sp.]